MAANEELVIVSMELVTVQLDGQETVAIGVLF